MKSTLELRVASLTDVGLARDQNEDACFAGEGVCINSGKYDGLHYQAAVVAILVYALAYTLELTLSVASYFGSEQ